MHTYTGIDIEVSEDQYAQNSIGNWGNALIVVLCVYFTTSLQICFKQKNELVRSHMHMYAIIW